MASPSNVYGEVSDSESAGGPPHTPLQEVELKAGGMLGDVLLSSRARLADIMTATGEKIGDLRIVLVASYARLGDILTATGTRVSEVLTSTGENIGELRTAAGVKVGQLELAVEAAALRLKNKAVQVESMGVKAVHMALSGAPDQAHTADGKAAGEAAVPAAMHADMMTATEPSI